MEPKANAKAIACAYELFKLVAKIESEYWLLPSGTSEKEAEEMKYLLDVVRRAEDKVMEVYGGFTWIPE